MHACLGWRRLQLNPLFNSLLWPAALAMRSSVLVDGVLTPFSRRCTFCRAVLSFAASSVLWQPRRGSGRKNGRADLCEVGARCFWRPRPPELRSL